jgi:hypothetical protein
LGEILLDAGLELRVLLERLLGDSVLAQVVPNKLVGVEIRCAARQEVQLEPTLDT